MRASARPGRPAAVVCVPARDVPRRRVPVAASARSLQAPPLVGRPLSGHRRGVRAGDPGRDAAQPRGQGRIRHMARAVRLLEVLAVPLPAARPRPEADARDRIDRVAARACRSLARVPIAWADSLGWLSVPEHRAELVTPPILVREQLRGHQEDLLRRLRSDCTGPSRVRRRSTSRGWPTWRSWIASSVRRPRRRRGSLARDGSGPARAIRTRWPARR